MGKKHITFRMNEQVETQLNVLELMIKDKPERFLHAPENRSALINLMLGDYANFLITNFKKGKSYDALKKQLTDLNTRKPISKNERLIQANFDKLSAILYLLISTNQSLQRLDMNDWRDIQSMYKQGTVEHEIYNKLKDMVEEDKIKAVKNAKQAGRRIKEWELEIVQSFIVYYTH